MHVLRSLLFYIAFYGGSVFHVLGALIAVHISPPRVRSFCDAWSAWHHWCTENLLGIKIQITGEMPDGSFLYAIKHEAFFEALEAPHLFDNPSGFAKQELFDIPGWGRAALAYGLIPVARDDGAKALRAMLKATRAPIAQGRPLLIYPEGTRIPHGQHAELQSGFAALYKMLRLSVIPVAVDSGPNYHRLWKKPGTIRVHFGEPIPPGLPRQEAEALTLAAINIFNPISQSPPSA